MTHTHVLRAAKNALVATLIIAVFGVFSYFAFEPTVGRAVTSNPHDFLVQQTITDEISFLVEAADVTMVGSIQGLTGGYATGTTYAVVQTNDPDGYSMTLSFSTTTAMQGEATTGVINNYTPATPSTADFNWIDNSTGGAAEFGYSVSASTTSDIDPTFQDNGASCGAGGADNILKCWLNPSTTAETIINRATAAATGATTTLRFKVAVPSAPSPSLPADLYTATGTLTATNNP